MFPRSRVLKVNADPVWDVLATMGLSSDTLAGRVALVTGGARGIGAQTARGLASLGARVVIADILDQRGEQVAASIEQHGGTARFERCDLAFERNVDQLIEQIERLDGPVDILLNNAVQIDIQSVLETTTEQWDYTHDTNVRAPFLLVRRVLPGMLERNTGTIANMIALEGMAYSAAMSASKVALRSFIISLCDELPADSGISVFGFAPGLVATDMVLDVFPRYADRIGVTFEEYVFGQTYNPGYEGLMPTEHCAAGLVHALVHAAEHHGLFAEPSVLWPARGSSISPSVTPARASRATPRDFGTTSPRSTPSTRASRTRSVAGPRYSRSRAARPSPSPRWACSPPGSPTRSTTR